MIITMKQARAYLQQMREDTSREMATSPPAAETKRAHLLLCALLGIGTTAVWPESVEVSDD